MQNMLFSLTGFPLLAIQDIKDRKEKCWVCVFSLPASSSCSLILMKGLVAQLLQGRTMLGSRAPEIPAALELSTRPGSCPPDQGV